MAENTAATENTTTENTQTTESKNETNDVDSKIKTALDAMKAEFAAELQKRDSKAKEAERLSKLSEEERIRAELENAQKELAEKTAALKSKETRLEMAKVLSERKIPQEFMDFFITDDNAKTLERIKTFEKYFKQAVESGVNEKLKSKPPSTSSTQAEGTPKTSFLKAILDGQIKR